MPVSKRDKKVSLTKTAKKGMPFKQKVVDEIRTLLDKHDHLFAFIVHNMRNSPLKELREDWKEHSRFFFAKKTIMSVALGRTEADEAHKNLHKVAAELGGECGLLFTNKPKDYVVKSFQDYSKMDFARSGFVATETVTIPAGPLPDFSSSIETHLREGLGLPTKLEKGVVVLRENHVVCTKGSPLTPEQANVLKLLGKQMAEFKIILLCVWSKDGSFEKFDVPKHLRPEFKPKVYIPKQKNEKTPKSKRRGKKPKSTEKPQSDKKMTPKEQIISAKSDKSNVEMDVETIDEEKGISKTKPLNKSQKTPESIKTGGKSPKLGKGNPRRSVRTPQTIKGTPDQPKQSVKKLTESAKHLKRTPNVKTKNTPKKQSMAQSIVGVI